MQISYPFVYSLTNKIADLLVVMAVWWGTWYLRFDSNFFPLTKGIPSSEVYFPIAYILAMIFCAVLHLIGGYRTERLGFGFRSAKKLLEGTLLSSLILVAYLYFTELYRFSRIYLVVFSLLCFIALNFERLVIQLIWNSLQPKFSPIKILCVGYGELLKFYFHEIKALSHRPIHWIGRLGPDTGRNDLLEMDYLGDEAQLLKTIRSQSVDTVVISYPSKDPSQYEHLLQILSNELASIKILPDFGKFSTFTYRAAEDCGIPILEFNLPPMGGSDRVTKRFLDIVGSLLFMILFSPLYLVLAILIKATSEGPIFYFQQRMGADGRLFQMYKFRTMRIDAENTSGAVWATRDDSRTTPIGKFLRKTSLDEIPQFFNVLKGEMSLVGPRPERPVFVEQFRDQVPRYMLRHKVKSGITGWAQINGWRGNTSIEERISHDLFYIRNWSVKLDIKILFLTLFRGFVHPNAY